MKMTINLDLTPKEAQYLIRKCAYHGVDAETLLNNFVQDLIGGSQRNGSDEYDLANRWLDQCWIGYERSKTFLTFLLEYDLVKSAVDTWNEIESAKEALANYVMNPTEGISLEDMKNEVTWYQNQFDELWNEYLEDFGIKDKDAHPIYEMPFVLDWWKKNYKLYMEA